MRVRPLDRVLCLLLFSSLLVPLATVPGAEAYSTREPIFIDGDAGFTPANGVVWGSGTATNPYIIEGWSIEARRANGIDIRNTRAAFVVRNILITDGSHGIYLYNVANGRVANSVVTESYYGIYAYQSTNVTIRRNTVTNSLHGWGIHLFAMAWANVTSNRATSNRDGGIMIGASDHVAAVGNNLSLGSTGIHVYRSSAVTLRVNTVTGHSTTGIHLQSSSGVAAFNNNLLDNAHQARDEGRGGNSWDAGYPTGGNFWSDYVGIDQCSGPLQDYCSGPDGIGDQPRRQGPLVDRYPLMAYHDSRPVAVLTASPSIGNATTPFTLDASRSSDLEDRPAALAFRWDWEDDGAWDTGWSNVGRVLKTFDELGIHSSRVEVRDTRGQVAQATTAVTIVPLPLRLRPTADRAWGAAPLDVTFGGRVTGGIGPYAYNWSFGDDALSTLPNPRHTYDRVGIFVATLRVTDARGEASEATIVITVGRPLELRLKGELPRGPAPLTAAFGAVALGGVPPYTYRWEFGDGTTSTEEAPYHTYDAPGTYVVKVTVVEGSGHSATLSTTVEVLPPRALIFPTPPPIAAPAAVVLLGIALAVVLLRARRR